MIQRPGWRTAAAAFALCAVSLAQRNPSNWDERRDQILEGIQDVMGPLPSSPSTPPEVIVIEQAQFPEFVRQKITFDSGDGDSVPAYLFLPTGPRRRRPAVLCLHQTAAIGMDEPAGIGGNENLHYARELAERGFVALAPDYPGFGEYAIDSYAMGYPSATMKGIRNHRRAVDVLASMPEVDPGRIGAIGHSLGGHNALFLAAFEPRIAAVVTSCGFTSFRKYKGGDLRGWSHFGYMPRIATDYWNAPELMPFDFSDVLALIAPRPVFINAPVFDANFDWSGVDDSVRSAQAIYSRVFHVRHKLRVVHPASAHDFPADVRAQAYSFLTRALARRYDETAK